MRIKKVVNSVGEWVDGKRRKIFPIDQKINEIVDTIFTNQVTIVEAETGAGKTVRIIQALLLAKEENVTVTSLRRGAVRGIATYIAREMGKKVGSIVGYRLAARGNRAVNKTSKNTRGVILVDASVLNQIVRSGRLPEGTLIVDEAHERTLQIDFLLSLCKVLLPASKNTRLVVTSATIDTRKFSQFFDNAPVISVEGRCFPVTVKSYVLSKHEHHVEGAVNCALKSLGEFNERGAIAVGDDSMSSGTILILLPGKVEIEKALDSALARAKELEIERRVQICGLGGWSSDAESDFVQTEVPDGQIRFVFTTEICRSQRTLPGVRLVIDSLRKKRVETNAVGGGRLNTVPISRAEANQGKGRAGRTSSGLYRPVTGANEYPYGLYEYPKPAIQSEPLTTTVLQLAKLIAGAKNFPAIKEFPFIDAPREEYFDVAISRLQKMGALDKEEGITGLGRKLLNFPVDPESAMALITADKLNVLGESLIVSAIRECQGIQFYPRKHGDRLWTVDLEILKLIVEKKDISLEDEIPNWLTPKAGSRFFEIDLSRLSDQGASYIVDVVRRHYAGESKSDFVGQVNLYRAYKAEERRLRALARKKGSKINFQQELFTWCQARFLKVKSLRRVDGVIHQIKSDLKRANLRLKQNVSFQRDFSAENLTKAVMTGRVDNVLVKTSDREYQGGIGNVRLSFKSPCASISPKFVLTGHPQKMGATGRHWYLVDEAAPVEFAWLEEILPKLCSSKLTESYSITDDGVVLEKREYFFQKTRIASEQVPAEPSEKVLRFLLNKTISSSLRDEFSFAETNEQIREEMKGLWIRSAGVYKRMADDGIIEFYLEKFRDFKVSSFSDIRVLIDEEKISEDDLALPNISKDQRALVYAQNPETVVVDGQILPVSYSKDSWSETFYTKVEVDRELAYSTKTESIILPSGRQVELTCDGKSAMTFSELVCKLLTSDCSNELTVLQEEPWQEQSGYWNSWSLTELGQSLKTQFEALVTEHAENPKADDMAGRIEALRQAINEVKVEIGGEYKTAQTVISEAESELSGLIAEMDDEVLVEVWQKQVSDGIKKAQEKLSAGDYDAVDEICGGLVETVKIGLSSAQDSYTGFREIWARRGGSNNGDGWVVRPDGSFREHDIIDNPRPRYANEGYKSWHLVLPEELAISWIKSSNASRHEFKVHHLPVDGLTGEQVNSLKELLNTLEEEWDGRCGMASGNVSPSVGEGWLNPETGESLIPGFVSDLQMHKEKTSKQMKADQEWAEAEGLPELMIEQAVERQDFSTLKTFVKNVDGLNGIALSEHICLDCGRKKREAHIENVSGMESREFFCGFDANDVTPWIWKRICGGKVSGKKVTMKSATSAGFNNPFAALAALKR